MQSVTFQTQKVPTVIKNSFLLVGLTAVMLAASLGFTVSRASAAASFMLIDAPACGTDCPYGPEGTFKRFNKVWMVCYKDMRWRHTNGQWSNRWFRVLSDRYPNQLRYTPAPAVGNQTRVGVCR